MKILILDKIDDESVAMLKSRFHVDEKHGLPEDEIISVIPDYSAIVVRSATKVTEKIIEAGKALKLIARAGTGVDNIDVAYATKKKIPVMNTPSSNSISVAELTIGLMLDLSRNISHLNSKLKDGNWDKSKGFEVYGKTLGIIGFGRIGKLVCERSLALGMKVKAYDVYALYKHIEEQGAVTADIDEIMKSCDYITIHLPLTRETKYIINKEKLEMMKKTAFIINTARGGLIDENALHDALKSKKIAGAALDVFETEPLLQSNLFSLDNMIATPHIGASTAEAQKRCGIDLAMQIIDFFSNQALSNIVNIDQLNSLNFPDIEIIAMHDIDAHELADEIRVKKLMASLKNDSMIRNPIMAAKIKDRFMIMDGATRHQALKEMGSPHLLAQVVNYDDSKVKLETWDHAIKGLDIEELVKSLREIKGLHVHPSSWHVAEKMLISGEIIGYVICKEEKVYILKTDSGYEAMVNILCIISEKLSHMGETVRITHEQVDDYFKSEKNHCVVMCWPRFTKDDIKKVFQSGLKVPAGITRHIVPCRVLGINLDLNLLLDKNDTIEMKNKYMKDYIHNKLSKGKIRFYDEPLFVMDN